MQTFLPFDDFEHCAKVLDDVTLQRQRIHVVVMLNALHGVKTAYREHACTRMWEGHEVQLCHYGLVMCEEWVRRGHRCGQTAELGYHLGLAVNGDGYSLDKPDFLGNEAFHRAQQSTLLRLAHAKGSDHYDEIFPDVPDDLEIFYPGVI